MLLRHLARKCEVCGESPIQWRNPTSRHAGNRWEESKADLCVHTEHLMRSLRQRRLRTKRHFFFCFHRTLGLQKGTPGTASLKAAVEEEGEGPQFGAKFLTALCGRGERAHLFIEPDDLVHFVVVL